MRSPIYKFDDERWREVTAAAEGAVRAADEHIAQVCRDQGIPEEFRPSLSIVWYGRGENAAAARRAEIRKVVTTRLDASAKEAKVAIEAAALERCEALAIGALESRRVIVREPDDDERETAHVAPSGQDHHMHPDGAPRRPTTTHAVAAPATPVIPPHGSGR